MPDELLKSADWTLCLLRVSIRYMAREMELPRGIRHGERARVPQARESNASDRDSSWIFLPFAGRIAGERA
jgi:hypothetical protein